jgi:hypothetical protein
MTLAKRDSAKQARIQKAIRAFVKRKGSVVHQDISALRNDIDVKDATVEDVANALRVVRCDPEIRIHTYRPGHELAGWTQIWYMESRRKRKRLPA